MLRLAVWLRCLATVALLSTGLASALAQTPGKDFQPVNPPQPTESANKVEVIEFFSYACPHCEAMEPSMAAWLKRKPADVDFKRVPAVFQDSWLPFARIYYTIDAMGLTEKLHHEVFAAIHKQKVRLQDPKVLFDWVATKGVDRKKFEETYNSFAVQSLTQRAPDITRRYNVPFTPSVVVDGRYLTGPSMTSTGSNVDYDHFYKVLDQMIATERSKKKTTSK